jgi:membrane associated rhomboid family serine protease
MNTGRRKSVLSYIPGYTNNAVLQVIIFSAITYTLLAFSWAIIKLVFDGDSSLYDLHFIPNLALPTLALYKAHWWTILTYGWFQNIGFMELISNMLWFYCFGSVVQSLVGHRQVIPLYVYSLLAGGVFYLLAQTLPGNFGYCPPYILGPRAALMGMAVAAITLTPRYRFYLTETFSIPILVVAGIFAFLMVLSSGYYMPVVLMLAGGGLMGVGYIKLLKAGYRPGAWMYVFADKMEGMVTPNEHVLRNKKSNHNIFHNPYGQQKELLQDRVDDILDKINQKGYNSLTSEEKDILTRVGRE